MSASLNAQYQNASNLNARIAIHEHFSINPYGWYRWVLDQVAAPPKARLLELGCGQGNLWKSNLGHIPGGWQITLSDFSAGMLAEARTNLAGAEGRFKFEHCDAQRLPFDDENFEVVIANHMLYHVPDRPQALAEIQRVLKPGGRFYAATNGLAHLQELDQIAEAGGLPIRQGRQAFGVAGFNLENGAAQIAAWFTAVELRRYPDGLIVTQAQPLVDYILSMNSVLDSPPGEALIERFKRSVEEQIAREGSLRITKDTGLFVGVKNKPAMNDSGRRCTG